MWYTVGTGAKSSFMNRKPFDNRLITDRATEDRLTAECAFSVYSEPGQPEWLPWSLNSQFRAPF